jgi:O-antigen/teichoic acid export membrane protein
MGKLRLFARLALLEAAMNLGLCFALVGSFGLEGVAVAVAVPNVLFCLFAIGYACLVLEVRISQYVLATWVKPLVAVGVPSSIWWFATPVEASWQAIAIGIGMGLVPYIFAVMVLEGAPVIATSRGRARESGVPLHIAANSVSN